MIFDSHFWPICIFFASISVALTYWLSFSFAPGKKLSLVRDSRRWRFDSQKQKVILLICVFVIDLLMQRYNIYYQMPVLVGSFFGYWSQVFLALLPAILIMVSSAYSFLKPTATKRPSILACAVSIMAAVSLKQCLQRKTMVFRNIKSKIWNYITSMDI